MPWDNACTEQAQCFLTLRLGLAVAFFVPDSLKTLKTIIHTSQGLRNPPSATARRVCGSGLCVTRRVPRTPIPLVTSKFQSSLQSHLFRIQDFQAAAACALNPPEFSTRQFNSVHGHVDIANDLRWVASSIRSALPRLPRGRPGKRSEFCQRSFHK